MVKSSAVLGLVTLALVACVSGEAEAPMGSAKFTRGAPALLADYQELAPGTGPVAGSASFAGATAPPAAGTTAPVAGTFGPPPVAGASAPPSAGTSAPPPVAGTSAPPVAGTSAPPPVAGTAAPPVAGTAAPPAGGTAAPPPAGTAAPPTGGTGAPPSSGTPGTLTIQFTSVAVGGRYAPRNVGACWIATGTGSFVKTLKRWAGIRANHLGSWNLASGGWFSFFGIGATQDELDAVTAATLRSHEAHSLTWDMIDNNGAVVPDGTYQVWVEVADDNIRPSGSTSVEFTKGPSPSNASSSTSPVSNMTVTYTP